MCEAWRWSSVLHKISERYIVVIYSSVNKTIWFPNFCEKLLAVEERVQFNMGIQAIWLNGISHFILFGCFVYAQISINYSTWSGKEIQRQWRHTFFSKQHILTLHRRVKSKSVEERFFNGNLWRYKTNSPPPLLIEPCCVLHRVLRRSYVHFRCKEEV